MNDLDQITKKLIEIKLKPQDLFPALNIANLEMQPLYSIVGEHVGLAIRGLEDNYSHENYEEYRLLIELRFYWVSMISNLRMYLLNQLYLIEQLHLSIKHKLLEIETLNRKEDLSFSTNCSGRISSRGIKVD